MYICSRFGRWPFLSVRQPLLMASWRTCTFVCCDCDVGLLVCCPGVHVWARKAWLDDCPFSYLIWIIHLWGTCRCASQGIVELHVFLAYKALYTCMHTPTHTCTHTHRERHTHPPTHTCTHTHTERHTHTHTHTYPGYLSMYICTYIRMSPSLHPPYPSRHPPFT